MKKLIKKYLRKRGYTIVSPIRHESEIEFRVGDFHYDFVAPIANYAPWKGDKGFVKAYNDIKTFTLVDEYRCFELWQLADKAYNIDPQAAFLEVGVWKGGTAGILASKLRDLKASTPVFIADTFSGVVKAGEQDSFYQGGEHKDTNQAIVEGLLKNTIGYECTILKGIFPDETAHKIPANTKFSLCHIDVDVYSSAKDIISYIWDKLIVGGTIIFDDYGFHWCTGITKLVEEQRQLSDRVIIHNLNGHAIIIKVK
jgi:O-methyltransferase